MSPIRSVLVANRGEIARRIFRTCRDLGIETVAVYSDPDAESPHVIEADSAVRLAGATPAETYLHGDLLIAAAKAAGADAIHPGYGFLSENAQFARSVIDADLTWIGPPPEAIESMGSKVESKRLMAAAGVPVLTELDPAAITEADLPVLIKASAGGGGRGMRVVERRADLSSQLDSARAEAESAFGDPTVFCESYFGRGRHIEVQILADQDGTVWTVGERECSIQRRHQKVIEEAPSPLVERTPGMRERLFDAARLAAEAVGYCGAGTVEFLAEESGQFFFLEMNTRLQVEHPVTECTTGLDLVRLQLEIAAGATLQTDPPARIGHAIEARLYAEDAAHDWRPQSGTLHRFVVEARAEFEVPAQYGIRIDSGVSTGSFVGVNYDPMLAKVISWAPDRRAAATLLATCLQRATLHGLTTNRDLLIRVLRHQGFLSGDTDTSFFDLHGLSTLAAPVLDADAENVCAAAAAIALATQNREAAEVQVSVPPGWRNVWSQSQCVRLTVGDRSHEIAYRHRRTGWQIDDNPSLSVLRSSPTSVVIASEGLRRTYEVAVYGDLVCVDCSLGAVSFTVAPRFADPTNQLTAGSLVAPMPGTVIRVAVRVGDSVTAGQPLLWLEAMKMEHTITAPADGILEQLPAVHGQQVELGAVLAILRPHHESNTGDPPEESS